MNLIRNVCGTVADRISDNFFSRLYEIPGEDTELDLLRLLFTSPIRDVEIAAFEKTNEYSSKET